MAEYLAPGVYVEETSYRSKSVEGVSTTTTGVVGQCRYGPVEGLPVLVTSFEQFQRRFGGLEDLTISGASVTNYLAHSVKAFFENGGKRCYISRIFNEDGNALADHAATSGNIAAGQLGYPISLTARYPGVAGNSKVTVTARRSRNLLANGELRGVRAGELIELSTGTEPNSDIVGAAPNDPLGSDLFWVELDDQGNPSLTNPAGNSPNLSNFDFAQRITLEVEVDAGGRTNVYSALSTHPSAENFIGRVLRTEDRQAGIDPPYNRAAIIYIDIADAYSEDDCLTLLSILNSNSPFTVDGGSDGAAVTATHFAGSGDGHQARGLEALAEMEDISIVAAPGAAVLDGAANAGERQSVRNHLISHCENLKYRFAILSDAAGTGFQGIRDARSQHDSTYAGMYYPWVVVADPFGQRGDTLELPPDGFMAGIFARSDIQHGVHKAPANEVVRGALRFNRHVTKGQQDVLNPEGINCLRFFEGRGYRVWGARTISSDPEWKYVNVRRLFIYLEHSIDRSTQWAVFEPNNHSLWLKIRTTISAFLESEQRKGALMGKTPEEGFFVRCDRSTMTQQDLDNGRLICLIGVAPTKPAEYVVFRIGQWTADAETV